MQSLVQQDQGLSRVRAEVLSVTFHAEDTGFTVLKARDVIKGGSFTAKGRFPTIYPGEYFEFQGTWVSHASYGQQFTVEKAMPTRPQSRGALVRYLGSGLIKGIGEKTAKRVVDVFGLETLDILDKEPERLASVPGLGQKKARAIVEAWQSQRANAEVMIFLSEHGVSPAFAQKIIRLYGAEAISIISTNPFRLADDVHGIGFVTADKIAQSVGIAKDSPLRVRAAIAYVLRGSEDDGHCYLTESQLWEALQQTLSLSKGELSALVHECCDTLLQENVIVKEVVNDDSGGGVIYFPSDLFLAELSIAYSLGEILRTPTSGYDQATEEYRLRVDRWVDKYCSQSGTSLSQLQRRSIVEAATSKVFVLTGGPGVGKTTTANAIIRLFHAMSKTVALGAPTGRAAQRLSEVSTAPAKTIHRLLEWSPADGGFTKNEDEPISSEVVIIDEASMLDVKLADALFRAVKRTSQLILIGDVDQLPSVGPGNLLRDVIASGKVPTVKLDEVFRQAAKSRIIQVSHGINRGETPSFPADSQSDCRFVEAATPDAIKEILRDLVNVRLPGAGYDPVRDVQVLTPMNRGELGTLQINEDLQQLLNPSKGEGQEFQRKNFILRPGDKVIQNVNNYDLSVFNGDIGFIEHGNVDGAKLVVNFAGRLVHYSAEQAMELRLAYAITIHKSQGSEFPVVILPIAMQHYIMLQRNLIYTGLTRARKLAIFIGSMRALTYAAANQTSLSRQTRLRERLCASR